MCTVELFVNIYTAKGTGHVWLFRDAKRVVVSLYLVKKINKMQSGRLELLASISFHVLN